jgi:type I restriction enzyme, R subunit
LRQVAEELLNEAEKEAAKFKQRLTELQQSTVSQSSQIIQQTIQQADDAEKQIDLDENESYESKNVPELEY